VAKPDIGLKETKPIGKKTKGERRIQMTTPENIQTSTAGNSQTADKPLEKRQTLTEINIGLIASSLKTYIENPNIIPHKLQQQVKSESSSLVKSIASFVADHREPNHGITSISLLKNMQSMQPAIKFNDFLERGETPESNFYINLRSQIALENGSNLISTKDGKNPWAKPVTIQGSDVIANKP
jgi:hypothetical protein